MNKRTKVEVFAMDFGKRYAWIHLYSDQHTKLAANSFTCFSTENNGKHLLSMYFLLSFIFLIYLLRGAMVEGRICTGILAALNPTCGPEPHSVKWLEKFHCPHEPKGERGGSVVECRTLEREVRGSRPTAAVLCPWARHFTPRKYWLITQEAMAPSRHDWKIVDWDVKPQHNQPTNMNLINFRKS